MARSDFRFAFGLRVRYAECDQQGVVFNAHYLTYFDTAVTEYVLRGLGYDYINQVKTTGSDFHTVRNLVEYRQPIGFDREIDVCVRAAKMGRSSLTFLLEIHPKGGDDLLASGDVVWVNTDQASHKSTALPEALIAKIKAFEGDRIQAP